MNELFGPWRQRSHLPPQDLGPAGSEWHPEPTIERIEATRAPRLLTGLVQLPAVPSPFRERFAAVLRDPEPAEEEPAPVTFHAPVAGTRAPAGPSPAESVSAYRAVLAEMNRALGGWVPPSLPPPLTAPAISAIAAETPETALVYLQMRAGETLALIVTATRRRGLTLPLTLDRVLALRRALRAAAPRSEGRIRHTGSKFNQERFAAALDDCLRVLGPAIWNRLDPALQDLGVRHVILLPDSFLALFPLHAAPLPVPDAPDRAVTAAAPAPPRLALDRYTIGYAPSAQVYAWCLAAARARPPAPAAPAPWAALVVGRGIAAGAGATAEPMQAIAVLAPLQTLAAQPRWDLGRVDWTAEAGLADLAAAWAGAGLLHLHVHGYFDPARPQEAAILLPAAPEGRLAANKIPELIPVRAAPRLAVLAVCEGGEVDVQIAPEFRGLATVFLQAGVPIVLASPWRLNEPITTLLLCRLYENVATGLPVAAALRQAQIWLRDADHPALQAELAVRVAAVQKRGRRINLFEARVTARLLHSLGDWLTREQRMLANLRTVLAVGDARLAGDQLWATRRAARKQASEEDPLGLSTRLLDIVNTLCAQYQARQVPDLAALERRVSALLARPYGAPHYWAGLQALGAALEAAV